MRVKKYILLLCIILCTSAVQAALLPPSSLYQGRSYFTTSTFSGKVEYAVYDTLGGNEYVNYTGYAAPGDGRYIYAYQIFVDDLSTNPLEYFAIFRLDGTAISGIASITAHDDYDGIEPTDAYYNGDATRGIWEFDNGLLVAGKHSWILLFSSNNSYTTGQYTVVKTASSDTILPGNEEGQIPEPASVAIVTLGTLWMSVKRKKSRLLY